MSLIIKVPGVAFSATLPRLERDAVILAGDTLGLYDAGNQVSWEKQSAPSVGAPSADRWINLVDAAADGKFYGTIPFSGGGFLSSPVDTTERIDLLNGTIPVIEGKILGITWVKHSATQAATGLHPILNVAQWVELRFASVATTNVEAGRFYATGVATANRQISVAPAANGIYQLAAFYESTTRVLKAFVNGVEVLSQPGYADLAAGGDSVRLMQRTGIQGQYGGTFFRAVLDKCANRTPADVVALDYALNNGRFA